MFAFMWSLYIGAAEPHAFAISVGVNQSFAPGRNVLQYADDDAAKYAKMMTLVANSEDIMVLADFDRDTEGLFSELLPIRPTLAKFALSIETISRAVSQARGRGEETEVYIFFAGHGDVREGKGFLELGDGALDSDALRQFVKRLGAHRVHIILDSCNSYFVVAPRKPGGRRFGTPADVQRVLSESLPNVGVVLSTSAESEVYEWSELQSGIFSHLVRSGLAGAADSNHDGAISYGELSAFIEVSSRTIVNPAYRPRVFVRGLSPDAVLFRPRRDVGFSVHVIPNARLTIRDARGLRWFDVHSEAEDAPFELRVPWASKESFEVFDADQAQRREVNSSRGMNEELNRLFAAPFGPTAYQQVQDERALQPPEVYGISFSEAQRLRTLVESFASNEQARWATDWAAAGLGLASILGSNIYAGVAIPEQRVAKFISAGVGSSMLFGIQCFLLCRSLTPARLHRTAQSLTEAVDVGQRMAQIDAQLRYFVRIDRKLRHWTAAGASALITLFVVGAIVAETNYAAGDLTLEEIIANRSASVVGILGTGLEIYKALAVKGTSQRLLSLWEQEPAVRDRPTLGFSPLPGGGLLFIAAQF